MALYLHGTTREGLQAMMSGEGKGSGPWTCCDRDGYTYLFDLENLREEHGTDEDGIGGSDFLYSAEVSRTGEQAAIQAAIRGESTKLYVLVIEADEDLMEPDVSCMDMGHIAVQLQCADLHRVEVVRVLEADYNLWWSPFILAGIMDMELSSARSLCDENLLKVAEMLKAQCYEHFSLTEVIEWRDSDVHVRFNAQADC